MTMGTVSDSPGALRKRGPSDRAPILVIDSEPAGAAITRGELLAAGFAASCEENGDAVLRLVRAELTRLVVSELYIPCSEGVCIVAALKNDRSRLPRLRVLVYSKHTAPADDAWALAAGCDTVLHKPGSKGALVQEIRRLGGEFAIEPDDASASQTPQ